MCVGWGGGGGGGGCGGGVSKESPETPLDLSLAHTFLQRTPMVALNNNG